MSERIRRWRESQEGLTIPELARRLGIFPEAVYQWESGKTKPTLENVEKFTQVLGVTLAAFWGEPPKARKARAS